MESVDRDPLAAHAFIDPPDQRIIIAALVVLVQSYKLLDAFNASRVPSAVADMLHVQLLPHEDINTLGAAGSSLLWKWLIIDWGMTTVLASLKIQRLELGWTGKVVMYGGLAMLDWLLLGSWTFSLGAAASYLFESLFLVQLTTSETLVRLSSMQSGYLGDRHTVHVLDASTAKLNPASISFCLPSNADQTVFLPVLLNNTRISRLRYSITSLDALSTEIFDVDAKDLIHSSPSSRSAHRPFNIDDWSSITDHDLDYPPSKPTIPPSLHHLISFPSSLSSSPSVHSSLQHSPELSRTQSMIFLPVRQVGSIQLEEVFDQDGTPINIVRRRSSTAHEHSSSSIPPSSTSRNQSSQLQQYSSGSPLTQWAATRVVTCPAAAFLNSTTSHFCHHPSSTSLLSLDLQCSGMAPLEVRLHTLSTLRGLKKSRREDTSLEGIGQRREAGQEANHDTSSFEHVAFDASISTPGRYEYILDSVRDADGNYVSLIPSSFSSSSIRNGPTSLPILSQHSSSSPSPSRTIIVHAVPHVSFQGQCTAGRPISSSGGTGRKVELELRISSENDGYVHASEGVGTEVYSVVIEYVPEMGSTASGWIRTVEMASSTAMSRFVAEDAGTYSILGIRGAYCSGLVLSPSTCNVISQPITSLTAFFEPIHDACGSERGFRANLRFIGSPPFVVHYQLSPVSPHLRHLHQQRISKTFHSSHGELSMEAPKGSGEWQYSILRMDDANYRNIEVAGLVRTQRVQAVADARWTESKKVVRRCEGERILVEINLEAEFPSDVEYSIPGQPIRTISGITSSPHSFDIALPSSVDEHGGSFALSLESIKDSNGCRRPLFSPDLLIEVIATRPTASVNAVDGSFSSVIRDHDATKVPIRFSGEPPFTIVYQSPSPPRSAPAPLVTVTARHLNAEINLLPPVLEGAYKLVSVRDRFCPTSGEIIGAKDWTVRHLPRPTMMLAASTGLEKSPGVFVRPPVCEGRSDAITLNLLGSPPFSIDYEIAFPHTLHSRRQSGHRHLHSTLYSTTSIQLSTSVAGHYSYIFHSVADAIYSDTKKLNPSGTRVEQDVFALPTATFLHTSKMSFCPNDRISSSDSHGMHVQLSGMPPFAIEMLVKEEGSATRHYRFEDIAATLWPVDLPFLLVAARSYTLSIISVSDARCKRSSMTGEDAETVTISVAEEATIAAMDSREDVCVGEILAYEMRGPAPYTINTRFIPLDSSAPAERHSLTVSKNQFSRIAATPGRFSIISIDGKSSQQCHSSPASESSLSLSASSLIDRTIHPLPSVRINQGRNIIENIRHGGEQEAEIRFDFQGTAPFRFTFERRRPEDRYPNDRTILESHTISDIYSSSYSIFTTQEGTWTVSYIADAFCSFPLPTRRV